MRLIPIGSQLQKFGYERRTDSSMEIIVISGIDGSGKTTVIESLQERIQRNGVKTHYVWMRYNHIFCKPVHGLCRLIGLSKRYNTRMGKVWRHEFYKSPFFCSLYIFLTYIDTWIGKVRLIHQLKGVDAELIICDRWILDIAIDLAVKTHDISFLRSKMCNTFFNLQPKNLRQYIVVRNEADILSCRLENLEDPDFQFRLKCYAEMLARNNVVKIDNNGSVPDSVEKILSDISWNSDQR